jgi:hypothetical protein
LGLLGCWVEEVDGLGQCPKGLGIRGAVDGLGDGVKDRAKSGLSLLGGWTEGADGLGQGLEPEGLTGPAHGVEG